MSDNAASATQPNHQDKQKSPVRDVENGILVRAASEAVRLTVAAVTIPLRLARPVIMSRALHPARTAADSALRTVVQTFASTIAEEVRFNRHIFTLVEIITDWAVDNVVAHNRVPELVRGQAERLIQHLGDNPGATAPLVQAAAPAYLDSLRQNPTLLRPLVRGVAGDYLAFVAEQPEAVHDAVAAAAGHYMETLRAQPYRLDGLVRTVGDRYVETLIRRPEALAALVTRVADGYLATLKSEPEQLDELVRKVGDRYLQHLHENPKDVQELVRMESATMASGIIGGVRARSTMGDDKLESLARRLLRKQPRPAPSADIPSFSAGSASEGTLP